MKSLSEILGGAQILLPVSFNPQECFEEYLSPEQRTFMALLGLVEKYLPQMADTRSPIGRPAFETEPFVRAFLARSFFRIPSTDGLRQRLKADPNLRQIVGFRKVPSAATFSRRMTALAATPLLTRALNTMTAQYHEGRIVGHISRDSTAIAVREKPANKKREVAPLPEPKRKRGRPRKGESRPAKKIGRLERQLRMKPGKAVAELDCVCAWGCKKNSQGNISFWKGCKLHLDVTDLGIPVTAVVTGANVHDSQLAIPMEKWTERKITYLYSVMDSAYDARPIVGYIEGKGRVPLIDPNKRRGGERIAFTPSQQERFKVRSVVERANSHLKDWFIPAQIFVRGIAKVSFQLLCAVLSLAALKILQHFELKPPPLEA